MLNSVSPMKVNSHFPPIFLHSNPNLLLHLTGFHPTLRNNPTHSTSSSLPHRETFNKQQSNILYYFLLFLLSIYHPSEAFFQIQVYNISSRESIYREHSSILNGEVSALHRPSSAGRISLWTPPRLWNPSREETHFSEAL